MKNLCMMMALSVLLFTACSNDESEKLKKENETLRNEIEQLKHAELIASPAGIALASMPYDKVNLRVKDLHDKAVAPASAPVMKVPMGWKFEEVFLRKMLDTSENGNNPAVGLIAYPILENNVMKIALVPYYESGNPTKMYHYTPKNNNIGAYNFSTICPPPAGCVYNMDIFETTIQDAYYFKGAGAF